MMKKSARKNHRKESFLNSIPDIRIEDQVEKLRGNTAFSIQYFDNSQAAGQDFRDWTQEQLAKLLTKLKEYSKKPMNYWAGQKVGAHHSNIFEIYNGFPMNSEFYHPKHVPIDVNWARFRLEGDMRLIGFVLPESTAGQFEIPSNVFYIVFLDAFHKFYPPKKTP